MNLIRFVAALTLIAAVPPPALSQTVDTKDRVISGNANLSIASKEAVSGNKVRDEDLRKVLTNPRVNLVVVQQRPGRTTGTEGAVVVEYRVVYAIGRDTGLKERKIGKEDYEWLIALAKKLHQE